MAPGTVIVGITETYELDNILGQGGMGIIYKATSGNGKTVVVKELHIDPAAYGAQADYQQALVDGPRRFKREAEILTNDIHHPAFPTGYGYFQDLGREFMAMDFIPGQDLQHVLDAAPNRQMDPNEVLRIGALVCDGLEAMHQHKDAVGKPDELYHRDIKPANIVLKPNNDICILDLGIARRVAQSRATGLRASRAGTFEYASPLVVAGGGGPRDDIYALAATMFHLVIGHPFVGGFKVDLANGFTIARATEVDALPSAWQPVFRKAIQNDENLRQRTVGAFKQDLIGLLPPALRPLPAAPAQPRRPAPTQSPISIPLPFAVSGGAPAPTPATANVAIIWTASNSFLLPSGVEYRQILAGRVISNRSGVPGANVTVTLISDSGGNGTAVQTQLHGDFSLSLADTTVPSSHSRRDLTVVVEDPNSGAELCREIVTIARPASVKRAGVSIWNAITLPCRAFGNWRQQRKLNRAPMIQANANAKAAKIAAAAQLKVATLQAQAPVIQAQQAAKLAKAQAAANAQAAKLNAQSQNPSTGSGWTYFGWVGAIVFLAITLYGILQDNAWIWSLAPLGVIWSLVGIRVFFTRGFFARFTRIVVICVTLAWAGSWWIFYSTQPPQPKIAVQDSAPAEAKSPTAESRPPEPTVWDKLKFWKKSPAETTNSGADKKASPSPQPPEPKPKPFTKENK